MLRYMSNLLGESAALPPVMMDGSVGGAGCKCPHRAVERCIACKSRKTAAGRPAGRRDCRIIRSMRPVGTLRRRTLWVGFAAVLVPLVVLLALQYRWLVKLDETSAIAHQATLDNYLVGVSTTSSPPIAGAPSGRSTSPPALHPGAPRQGGLPLQEEGCEGARRLFVAST